MRVRFRVRFHQQMTYVIWTSSACRLHTRLSCPISCSTTPGVICMLSTHHPHVIRMFVCRHTCHLHIICMSSAHTCHPHAIFMSSAHFPELPNFMQYYSWCHLHIICRHTCHPHVICTSSADMYLICTVLMDPNCISCAKDISY